MTTSFLFSGLRTYRWTDGSHRLYPEPRKSSTNRGTVTETVKDTNVYIPAMDLPFTATLFKPNSRLYVFFDGKDVTQYTQQEGKSIGDPIITSSIGDVKGTFHVPNNSQMKFVAGVKEFKLTDSPKNDDTETTYGSSYFTYMGDSDKTGSQDTGGTQYTNKSIDPLVQSFTVLDKGGIYLNGLNLYFLQKDPKYAILLQIREINEDKVSNSYLADSNSVIQPNMIAISGDGSVATQIRFSNPVYLQEGKEYGIYLVTNSPANIALATCEYGKTDSLNRLSTKDPRIGSIMKYLGSDAWLKDSTKGLKFDILKCKFDTTKIYTLSLDNTELGTKALLDNSLSITKDYNTITVTDPNHSFNVGSFVTISGLTPDTEIGNTGINTNDINGVHEIKSVTWNTYSFNTIIRSGTEVDIPVAKDSAIFGQNVVTDYDLQFDNILINNAQILLSDTTLNYSFKSISGQSLDGTEVPYVFDSSYSEISNQTNYTPSRVKKISSTYNEQYKNPGSAKSLQIKVQFKTNNENISPVVDKQNTNVALLENIINNQFDDELTTNNGKGIARYITKDINLAEQSNGLRVTFYANVQSNANVRVYYKTLPVDSTKSLSEVEWTEMTLDSTVGKANNSSTFDTYTYSVYNLPLFKAFKTKVLMDATDSTKPPLIRKYRAIAFQGQ